LTGLLEQARASDSLADKIAAFEKIGRWIAIKNRLRPKTKRPEHRWVPSKRSVTVSALVPKCPSYGTVNMRDDRSAIRQYRGGADAPTAGA
jgi:hypothetical protein